MQLAASLAGKATVSAIFRHQGKHMATGGDAQTSRFEDRLKSGMARSMEDMHSPGYTGQRDSEFLAMLIPHHEGVADMARPVLIHWARPDGAEDRRRDHCQPESGSPRCAGGWRFCARSRILSRAGIRLWGLCGVGVDCTGCGDGEVLANAGRFSFGRFGVEPWADSFQP